ncbi:MAG: OsmC family protein [Ignavibacteria bacterium]|nr:OsmC family protein [Ignavibacteria bacterium]
MKMEILLDSNKKVNARYKNHLIKTDQPVDEGGEDSAPAPFDLFLASIGTCAGYYVKSFCDSRNIPTDNIKLIQSVKFNSEKHMIDSIIIDIQLPEEFPEKYRNAVINAANLCTVKKHLHYPPVIELKTSVNLIEERV